MSISTRIIAQLMYTHISHRRKALKCTNELIKSSIFSVYILLFVQHYNGVGYAHKNCFKANTLFFFSFSLALAEALNSISGYGTNIFLFARKVLILLER